MTTRNWQNVFEQGQSIDPKFAALLQAMDADVTTALAAATGGSITFLAALRGSNQAPVRNVRADATKITALAGSALTVLTGYTGNDIVEPTVLYDSAAPFAADANGLNGYEYVLCAAPYFNSDDQYENPCLWVSHDGSTWYPIKFSTVATTTTPASGGSVDTAYAGGYTVTPIVATNNQGDAHNSDPGLFRGPDGTYYVLWNQSLNATGSGGTGTGSNNWGIKISKASSLLGPWSTPVSVVQTVLASDRPSAPSMFWDGTQWQMYALDLHNTSATAFERYTNTSSDPTTGSWTKQTNPTISVPSAYSSQVWWHHNAYRWGNAHVLLVQDTAAGSSGSGNLWLFTSFDNGATWTVPSAPMFTGGWYRSAAVVTDVGLGTGLDLFYGAQPSNWTLNRTTASWKSQAIEPQFPPTGKTWRIGPSWGSGAAITPVLNTAYAAPILVYKDAPITAIGASVASAGTAGSVVRLGLYADNGNCSPGALLFDAGTIDGTSATFQEIAITKALAPGVYWIVACWQTAAVGTIQGLTGVCPLVAENPGTAASGHRIAYTQTGVTGALPNSFGTPAGHDFAVRATLKVT